MKKNESLEIRNENSSLSNNDYHEIVEIYALRVCKLWDYYIEISDNLNEHLNNGSLTSEAHQKRLRDLKKTTRTMLAQLFIEQYYNTGDEDLFDRAMMLDENIELEPVSMIDMEELKRSEEKDRSFDTSVLFFYQGLLLTIGPDGIILPEENHIKALIRNAEEVQKVNKKLERGRTILEIDEVTLGKKYYQGLCYRTHYSRF